LRGAKQHSLVLLSVVHTVRLGFDVGSVARDHACSCLPGCCADADWPGACLSSRVDFGPLRRSSAASAVLRMCADYGCSAGLGFLAGLAFARLAQRGGGGGARVAIERGARCGAAVRR